MAAERKQLQLILNISGTAAHQALDGINGAFGLSEETATRRFTDNYAATRIEANDRGAKRAAIRTRDTLRLARLRIQICDEAVGGAEIDSDDSAHDENRRAKALATQAPFERWLTDRSEERRVGKEWRL